MSSSHHIYEILPRKDKRGVDLISDALPFGRLWYAEPDAISNAIGYAKFFSRSHDAVIRVYDVGLPNPSQHVQCRMAYAWPFFTSSSSPQTSDVGAEMTSIPRRFASARTSSITGSAPLAPVPTMSRLPPQGISSPAESGVWPHFSRNCLEGPFFRFRTLLPSITTSCV